MKNFLLASFAMLLLVCTGCNKDDDASPAINPGTVNTTVQSGTWRVTYYFDTDHEETNHFTGYNFTFGSTGTLSASNGTTTVPGSWAAGTDDSKTKLDITFASPADFAELSEDWEVIEISSTVIKLRHVSGGGGGTDLLNFQKN